MEPTYAIVVKPEKFTPYISFYFEKGDLKESLEGVLGWFESHSLVFESWTGECAYDHWYENEGYTEHFENKEDLLAGSISIFDYLECNGTTRNEGRSFRLVIHLSNMSSHLEVKGFDFPCEGCESWRELGSIHYKLVGNYPEF